MRSAVAIVTMAVLASATWAAPASAQEDGVYFDDPDSPGGKEYAIPHERERRDNTGSEGGGSGGDDPRFGAGIEPEDGGSGGSGGSGGGGSAGDEGSSGVAGESDAGGSAGGGSAGGDGSGSGDGAGSDGEASEGAAEGSGSENGASYQATSSSNDPELSLSALALGVIIVGGGFGLLLRRTRRDPAG